MPSATRLGSYHADYFLATIAGCDGSSVHPVGWSGLAVRWLGYDVIHFRY